MDAAVPQHLAIAHAAGGVSGLVGGDVLAVVAGQGVANVVDAIRNVISIGGDSDTLAAITGAIAEAYYGVPDELWEQAKVFMDDGGGLADTVERFYTLEDTIV